MAKGTIILEFEGISQEVTERYRGIFEALFASGSLNIRSGQVTVHFDHEGTLQLIETHEKRWVRRKS